MNEEMQNFKCLLGCLLGLTSVEVGVYLTLYKSGEAGVDELANIVGKDRTTVYRSLQTLMAKNLSIENIVF